MLLSKGIKSGAEDFLNILKMDMAFAFQNAGVAMRAFELLVVLAFQRYEDGNHFLPGILYQLNR